ncbi:MAG: RhsD protein [Micavibrio sp.]|nr:RhsD protein [Micavibrio sp.]
MSGLYKMITALMFISAVFTWEMGKFPQHSAAPVPVLSAQAERHILYGNKHGGGGHLSGQNKSCKSEFPANWDAKKIISTVKAQAANDNNWKKADNGYQTSERTVDGVRIRIVLDGKSNEIVTAYPVNVRRNSCLNE